MRAYGWKTVAGRSPSFSPAQRELMGAFTDVVNVKDFGAKGDGTTDDTATIQACFDYVWGPAGSPRGLAGPRAAIYFPIGTYIITSTLYITQAYGGYIFSSTSGAPGPQSGATLSWGGSSYPGNTLPVGSGGTPDHTITPMVAFNGFQGRWENITFSMNNMTGHNTCGIYGYSATNSSSPVFFDNCTFIQGDIGVYLGVGSPNNISEWYFDRGGCTGLGTAGVWIQNQNTLNIMFRNWGCNNCGNNALTTINGVSQLPIGAGITNISGGMPTLIGCAMSQNAIDIADISGNTLFIVGIRTESGHFLRLGSGLAHCTGCLQAATGALFTGYTVGTTLTVTAVTSATNVQTGIGGMQCIANDGTNSLPKGTGAVPNTYVVKQLSGAVGGIGTYQLSVAGSPGNVFTSGSPGTIKILPIFCDLQAAGIILDSCGGAAGTIIGANSQVWVRGNHWLSGVTINSDQFGQGFLGQVVEYDSGIAQNSGQFATLPAPSAAFKGVRVSITDGLVAASTANFSSTVSAGGGSNALPLWCDGTNWRIG